MPQAAPYRKTIRHFREPRDIHDNPVKRGLCQKARDWRWSSARFYESDGTILDPLLPRIVPLPAEFWAGG